MKQKNGRKLNIGMVGVGFVGQVAHLMNYIEIENCRVVALAEYRPELRKKVAERYGIARTYASHHELLKDPDVEAVVIVTPRAYTAQTALDCLKAGKHVMTEKPMACTLKHAQMLVDAAKKKKVRYVVGHMKRHDEGVEIAKRLFDELVLSQELGPVQFARARCYMGNSYANIDGHIKTEEKTKYPDQGLPVAPEWLPKELTEKYAHFVNTFSHDTNLLRYFFDETPSVEYARFELPHIQIAVLEFKGFPASLEVGSMTNYDWDETLDIYFQHGHLHVKSFPSFLRNIPAEIRLYKGAGGHKVIEPKADWTWAFRRQAQAFVDDILNDRESISSGEKTLGDLVLIEDMWRKDLERRQKKAKNKN